MMSLLYLLALALQDDPKILQQKARERAQEMRQECAAALESVDGVGSVGLGGTGTDYRLLIVTRDAATQRHVRDLIGGDEYGGVRIVWSISDPARRPPSAPEPFNEKPQARQPEPVPDRANPWNVSVTDCDIIREHLRMKPVTHPVGNGKSWVPCQVMRRTTIGPGGGATFTYTNHRPDCPVRLGRVGEPPWADNYMAWVFRQGITPAAPTGMTLPGNGWAWAAQTAADMASRLPNIREGSNAGPVWVGGYGWVYPYTPYSAPYYYYYPYRYWHPRPYYRWHYFVRWRHCR